MGNGFTRIVLAERLPAEFQGGPVAQRKRKRGVLFNRPEGFNGREWVTGAMQPNQRAVELQFRVIRFLEQVSGTLYPGIVPLIFLHQFTHQACRVGPAQGGAGEQGEKKRSGRKGRNAVSVQ